ncbi:protocatechuate 3,4-dioxygenase subunit alpha [uncultured Enterovirga sp.]|uniref:protocatechuate 3,4-dioxygenase subunit alpha n=1 Tax=uncultured Enterovirga sp. TaxID=2026352 RepID=UPI0035CA001C
MTTDAPPRGLTPSQTVGPFFAYVLTPKAYGYPEIVTHDLATPDAFGDRIRIEGYVIDGDGEPIVDAMLEIWQPDGQGRFAGSGEEVGQSNSAFTGFGRTEVDSNGFYGFMTVRPGEVSWDGKPQAPHANVSIFARGLLKRLFTRIYFEGEAANADDPVLALVPEARRGTLIAKRRERGGDIVYSFDIRLQGEGETVFFEA